MEMDETNEHVNNRGKRLITHGDAEKQKLITEPQTIKHGKVRTRQQQRKNKTASNDDIKKQRLGQRTVHQIISPLKNNKFYANLLFPAYLLHK